MAKERTRRAAKARAIRAAKASQRRSVPSRILRMVGTFTEGIVGRLGLLHVARHLAEV